METIAEIVIAREVMLHQPEVRRAADKVRALLHADYREYGYSGRVYDRADQLTKLPDEKPVEIWAEDFEVKPLGGQQMLVTYISGHVGEKGERTRFARRSSIWVETLAGWQMIFHQATPFVPDDALAPLAATPAPK